MLSLNKLCIRLVFCLYAEDSGIFKKEVFLKFLRTIEKPSDFKRDIYMLFEALNTENRPSLCDRALIKFPYVDGELFTDRSLEVLENLDAHFDYAGMLNCLIEMSENFNWSKISPVVFGSIFESIMNPETRRAGGIHYTSPENIHKLIDPLFMDELREEFSKCKTVEEYRTLHEKISRLTFFDPACGSGNFLTETYISLRQLEDQILEHTHDEIKVSIENFYGIEINDFAVRVSKLALWISEHQYHNRENFLPLTRNARIMKGNSLKIDWHDVINNPDYVMGNPPYLGHQYRTKDQIADMDFVFKNFPRYGKLDYVCAWIFTIRKSKPRLYRRIQSVKANRLVFYGNLCSTLV